MQKYLFILLFLVFSCEETVEPDTSAPTVVITYPVNETTLTATTIVKVDVSDNGEINSVIFLIDGTEAYADSTAPYEYEWDVCILGTGSHSVLVKAVDSAGNEGQSELYSFTINASYDCADVCGGSAEVDECGECGGDGIADGACDCDGNVLDACGICRGDNLNSDGNHCSDIENLNQLITDFNFPADPDVQWDENGRIISLDFSLFWASHNGGTISESLCALTTLKSIKFNGTADCAGSHNLKYIIIDSFPECIDSLQSLETLYIEIAKLTTLPSSICNLPNSTEIKLRCNNLTEDYRYDCIDTWCIQTCSCSNYWCE